MLVWVDVLLDVLVEARVPVFPELVFPGLAPAACAPVDARIPTRTAAVSARIEGRLTISASAYAPQRRPALLYRPVYFMTRLALCHFSRQSPRSSTYQQATAFAAPPPSFADKSFISGPCFSLFETILSSVMSRPSYRKSPLVHGFIICSKSDAVRSLGFSGCSSSSRSGKGENRCQPRRRSRFACGKALENGSKGSFGRGI